MINQDLAEQKEIDKIQRGKRDKNAGYSEPGFNFGLGEYVKDKDHYKKIVRERKAKDPNFRDIG